MAEQEDGLVWKGRFIMVLTVLLVGGSFGIVDRFVIQPPAIAARRSRITEEFEEQLAELRVESKRRLDSIKETAGMKQSRKIFALTDKVQLLEREVRKLARKLAFAEQTSIDQSLESKKYKGLHSRVDKELKLARTRILGLEKRNGELDRAGNTILSKYLASGELHKQSLEEVGSRLAKLTTSIPPKGKTLPKGFTEQLRRLLKRIRRLAAVKPK